ncbi:hypothetical protein RFI_30356, partial [Reticulomyxa filosa]
VHNFQNVNIFELVDPFFPFHALVYELNLVDENDVQQQQQQLYWTDVLNLSKMIFYCIDYLQSANIPHNILFAVNRKRSVYLIPRQSQVRMTRFNNTPGFPDLGGFVVLLDRSSFDHVTAQTIFDEYKRKVSLSDETWKQVKDACLSGSI